MQITEEQKIRFWRKPSCWLANMIFPASVLSGTISCANGTAYIVQEYLPGGTLKRILEKSAASSAGSR